MFGDYLERWGLTPDGEPIVTPTSRLLPVRAGGVPAMLKIAVLDEERLGNLLMTWWNGHGAPRVLAHGDEAILMERAEDGTSLADAARSRGDDEASRVICSVLAKLHAPRGRPPPALVLLTEWFEPLGRAAEAQGGILRLAAATASNLLASQRDIVVLHGDMHHGKCARLWLTRMVGDRSQGPRRGTVLRLRKHLLQSRQ
jgi:streptomycin 6-kinase